MTAIRPLEVSDIPQVASLYERLMRSGSRRPPPLLGAYLARTYLDHPWYDPDIPSLVYEDEAGRIVGFIGSTVRHIRFDGKPMRAAYSGPLLADPESRSRAVGTFLLRRFMSGPQALTATDAATDVVRRIWVRLGGEVVDLSCIRWVRVFQPLRTAELFAERARWRTSRFVTAPLRRPVDALAARLARDVFRTEQPAAHPEPLTPAALVEHAPMLAPKRRLVPDYDLAFTEWLFRELASLPSRGRFVATLLRGKHGQVIGWYIGHVMHRGQSQVLQVAAADGHLGTVVEHFMYAAERAGAAYLTGRLEPHLLPLLSARHCVLYSDKTALMAVHSRDCEITQSILAGRAVLTRLEGETWLGLRVEPFAEERGA